MWGEAGGVRAACWLSPGTNTITLFVPPLCLHAAGSTGGRASERRKGIDVRGGERRGHIGVLGCACVYGSAHTGYIDQKNPPKVLGGRACERLRQNYGFVV